MEPWQSWTVVVLGGGAAWWYYNSMTNPRTRTNRAISVSESTLAKSTKRREDNKAKRRRDDAPGTSEPSGSDLPEAPTATSSSIRANEPLKRRKGGTDKADIAALSSVVDKPAQGAGLQNETDGVDEGLDNKEFAKQLSDLKTGTSLKPPPRPETVRKAARGSRAYGAGQISRVDQNKASSSQNVSATSSTAGADADDDLSPAASPAFGASSVPNNRNPANGDISDMLEAPAAGPSVLRLTESAQGSHTKQSQQLRSFQVQETKKQRQNRQKAEEKKLAREQQEKERRILLEKQLRTAREAESRPARNGVPSKVPSTDAWPGQVMGSNAQAGSSTSTSMAHNAPLLDTFDQKDSNNNYASSTGTSGRTSQAARRWESDLPSEEEQMKMINEMNSDDGWNTVPKGKKGKKTVPGPHGNTNGNDSSDAGLSQSKPTSDDYSRAVKAAHTEDGGDEGWSASNSAATLSSGNGHVNDSDWAVV
ncbi:MAG: hypothetical protein M1827_006545 [Pycnora praestabilis]|nr:MAG: hypothetical protein M1827_006545 [Pycnora praestabilis]